MSGRFVLDQGHDTPGDTVPAAVGAPESLVVHLAFPLGALMAGPVDAVLTSAGVAVADNPAESFSARLLAKCTTCKPGGGVSRPPAAVRCVACPAPAWVCPECACSIHAGLNRNTHYACVCVADAYSKKVLESTATRRS